MCNIHGNHMIQNSLVRIQAENLIPEKPNKQSPAHALSKCLKQQSHLTETVKNDLILNMTPQTRTKTFPNMSKPSLSSPIPKETTESKRHILRGKLNKLKSDHIKISCLPLWATVRNQTC